MLVRVTALALLGYISAALLAQVIVAILVTALRPRPSLVDPVQGRSLPNAAWTGLRAFRVRSREDEDDATSQTSFYLEPVDQQPLAPYRAGQFLTFQLELPDAQGQVRRVTRCYSLSDRHDPQAFRITVKRVPAPRDRPDLSPGLVSNHFLDRVAPGAILQLRAPAGAFVLGDDPSVPAVLIAGGIGITPLFAMARAALATQPDRALHLFYGVQDRRELVFEADLLAMQQQHPNFHVTIVQSCPLPGKAEGDSFHATGFIDVALLRRVLPHGRHSFYVCGPPPMMASLVPALREWGVAGDAVHYEAFGPASIESPEQGIAAPLETPIEIQFVTSARTLSWTGADTNLLDFAERHGIAVDSGCRSGSCGTCETALTAGEVGYAQPSSFEVAKGHCLLCVAVPTGDLVLQA
ncbi:2Fe-2S iron-sulfur cluster-binding protein [Sphingomonas hengshuiensis]|uniref:2Fe-2S iron-sulfur cluster-binding protein n=1 Tax=Sphingomonas hengshuiensis TaxID=1609977 RepID=UPI000980E78F|nr:2Fe-2S iron-sulfur cluster-binding protein [Sphingomonas hengshuiensis]